MNQLRPKGRSISAGSRADLSSAGTTKKEIRLIAPGEFAQRHIVRRGFTLGNERRFGIRGEHDRKPRACAFPAQCQHRKHGMFQVAERNGALRNPQPEGGCCVKQGRDAERRRELLQDHARIERHALHAAQACKRPQQITRLDRRIRMQRQISSSRPTRRCGWPSYVF